MMLLKKYDDFIDRVNGLGFMALSNILPGFPSLTAETPKEIWHTGIPDTDPWCWKDRAAEEKRLAFGCILGGHKGFISERMYPLFYKAFHPQEHMEERRLSGEISQTVWQLWEFLPGCMGEQQAMPATSQRGTLLDTADIRREMGVKLKKGGSKVDRAIKELQQYFYITVAGSRRKTDKYGQPYGWPANVYDRVENWAPEGWIKQNPDLSREDAREMILDAGMLICKDVSRSELARTLGM